MANVLRTQSLPSARQGDVYMTLAGQRYHCISITEFEASVDITVGEAKPLNSKMTGHKMVGATGKLKGKQYKCDSVMPKAVTDWLNGKGPAPVFETVVTNDDDSSDVGAQTFVYGDCMFSSAVLSKLATGDEFIEEDLEGTFDSLEMPEGYTLLDGVEM